MGLFSPKISPREAEHIQSRLVQLEDTVRLINTTTKPDVFFKRLNFALDILLDLQSYEKYGVFKGNTPSSDYNRIIHNMEVTVNDFIDRAVTANQQKLASLKTEKAKQNNHEKFAETLITAFDHANTFWTGSFSQTRAYPHYTGPLFTANNYQRVQSIARTPARHPQFCGMCGNKLNTGDKFCPRCGACVPQV